MGHMRSEDWWLLASRVAFASATAIMVGTLIFVVWALS